MTDYCSWERSEVGVKVEGFVYTWKRLDLGLKVSRPCVGGELQWFAYMYKGKVRFRVKVEGLYIHGKG